MLQCPKCHSKEEHPNGRHILIRGYKQTDAQGRLWSQCLVCAGYYNADLTVKPVGKDGINPDYNHEGGWFHTT